MRRIAPTSAKEYAVLRRQSGSGRRREMSDFSVSAIIPTKNRPDDVRLTLRSLLAQSVQALEVIIIDQSDDDRSKVVASEVFRSASGKGIALPELRYVHDTSIRGVSQARNRALDMAKGAIWLFLDDDVEMAPVLSKSFKKSLR